MAEKENTTTTSLLKQVLEATKQLHKDLLDLSSQMSSLDLGFKTLNHLLMNDFDRAYLWKTNPDASQECTPAEGWTLMVTKEGGWVVHHQTGEGITDFEKHGQIGNVEEAKAIVIELFTVVSQKGFLDEYQKQLSLLKQENIDTEEDE